MKKEKEYPIFLTEEEIKEVLDLIHNNSKEVRSILERKIEFNLESIQMCKIVCP